MAAQPQQLTPQQIITQEDFMKLFDRGGGGGGTVPVDTEKDSLKRPYPAGFSQFDPASKRPLPIIPQMQNSMLTHQHLMQQAALQAAMQGRPLPTTVQNSYFSPHLRPIDTSATQQLRPPDSVQQLRAPLDSASAQQMRQIDQQNAAAQQYRSHEQAMAQRLHRQLPTQMMQNQAVQMRNQQIAVQEYHNLLRLAQPPGLQQPRRQTISGNNISAQMPSSVARLQRSATTIEPSYSSSLQFSHQISPALSSLATSPISLATPIQIQQQNLLAQQIMSNAMRVAGTNMPPPPLQMVPTSKSQTTTNPGAVQQTTTILSGGMGDAEFLAFLENVRQIEAHLTRTLAESIQRSTAAQQQS
ncbi:hypothetical protein Angca_002023 [Angiostrongylus cantonensis]|nr:hypothetical protein Angca_002023 [Angiostrongylus cantonensis]